MRIGIVIGSTRPGRVGAGVGQWVHAVATSLGPAEHDGEAVLGAGADTTDPVLPLRTAVVAARAKVEIANKLSPTGDVPRLQAAAAAGEGCGAPGWALMAAASPIRIQK